MRSHTKLRTDQFGRFGRLLVTNELTYLADKQSLYIGNHGITIPKIFSGRRDFFLIFQQL